MSDNDNENNEQSEHPAIQAIIDAIEAHGGKVIAKTFDAAEEKPSIITRDDITRALDTFDRSVREAEAIFGEKLGDDQDHYAHRSTCTVLALLLGDNNAFGRALSSYKKAMELWDQRQDDPPTARECIRYQVATSIGIPSFALEVGLFAGAVLGRGGFTNDEVIRLMAEPAFTHRVLTLNYNVADLCSLAGETLKRLDAAGAMKN